MYNIVLKSKVKLDDTGIVKFQYEHTFYSNSVN